MNDKYTGYLGQNFRGDYHPRTGSSSSQALFTYPRRVILSLLAGWPRIFPYPRTEYWACPFLTQVVYMRMDIGPGLLQCSLDTGYQLAPTLIYSYYSSILFFFFFWMEDIEFILAIGIHVEFTIYNDDTSCLQNIKIHL